MALLYAVIANMFFYRGGYLLHFPERPVPARVERFALIIVTCICPRSWAERQLHPDVWICLSSTCREEARRRAAAAGARAG
jgi:hypothetical protein